MATPAPTPDPRHVMGRSGEQLAVEHLQRLDYEIVARNFRTRYGELDIVAFRNGVLVFVEVKTRRAGSGSPFESLHLKKRAQVRRIASAYLNAMPERPRGNMLRFDAIGIFVKATGELHSLEHLEGAF